MWTICLRLRKRRERPEQHTGLGENKTSAPKGKGVEESVERERCSIVARARRRRCVKPPPVEGCVTNDRGHLQSVQGRASAVANRS